MKIICRIIFTFGLLFCSGSIFAQQTERARGIELYQKGNYENAVRILRQEAEKNKDDADVWHYLGWSLVQTQNLKAGKEAFEKAVKLRPQETRSIVGLAYVALLSDKLNDAKKNAEKVLAVDPKDAQANYFLSLVKLRQGDYKAARETANEAIRKNPTFAYVYWVKVLAVLNRTIGEAGLEDVPLANRTELYNEVMAILENFPNLNANTPETLFIKEKITNLQILGRYFKEPLNSPPTVPTFIPLPDPQITPIKITSKPRVNYTDLAREKRVSGTIRLAVLFSSNGTIEYVLPLRGLGYGLTEEAIKAAYGIKFSPQLKNGKPVSVVKIVEYGFSVG